MNWPTVPLGEVCEIIMGQAPKGATYNTNGEGLALIGGASDFGVAFPKPKKFTSAPTKTSKPGDIILSIRATIGPKVEADGQYCLGRGVAALRAKSKLDRRYLWHWLTQSHNTLLGKARGATFLQVSSEDIKSLPVPLPPLEEQRRIAAILDKADALRQKRKQAIALLDSLTQSIFLEMFGAPAQNPNGFDEMTLDEIAEKLSDGPFGSNLKSSHYVEKGIRVVRLQNIGCGEFLDDDKAYISDFHFSQLKKHECRPGDVLIGTLGDPNLRACIQPQWLDQALNKADCLRLRPLPNRTTSEYCAALLNQPSTMSLARNLILGQTRGRISLGRLRKLKLPFPPVAKQREFSNRVSVLNDIKHDHLAHEGQLRSLFFSLQHRAFSGQL